MCFIPAEYSAHACHEAHFFLKRKDPEFFREVVQPHLRNKAELDFLDKYLLGHDLSTFKYPGPMSKLNGLEKALLVGTAVTDPDEAMHFARTLAAQARGATSPQTLSSRFTAALKFGRMESDSPAPAPQHKKMRAALGRRAESNSIRRRARRRS